MRPVTQGKTGCGQLMTGLCEVSFGCTRQGAHLSYRADEESFMPGLFLVSVAR